MGRGGAQWIAPSSNPSQFWVVQQLCTPGTLAKCGVTTQCTQCAGCAWQPPPLFSLLTHLDWWPNGPIKMASRATAAVSNYICTATHDNN